MSDGTATVPRDLSDITAGFQSLVGYRLTKWEPDLAELELDLRDAHLNRSGFVHGGVHATLLDAAGGIAGVFCAVAGNVVRASTLAFSIQFIDAPRGASLRAVARKRGGGTRIFFSAVEVFDGEGRLVAAGEGTYRYMPGFEPPKGGPRDASVPRKGG